MSRRRLLHAAALAVLLPMLGGCLTLPVPDLHVDLPPAWRQPLPQEAPPATAPWWQAFGDPQLDALVSQALASNLDIGQARARLRGARALARTSDAELRPDLRFRTSDPVDPDASASYVMIGFDSVWELGLFGRGQGLHRMARGDMEGAAADLDDARLTVAAEVARQWILLRQAQQRARLLQDIADQRAAQVRLVDTRVRLRLASTQDAAKARAASDAASVALAEPRVAGATAAQALALLLARAEPDPAWLQPAPLPQLQAHAIDAVPADLVRRRPDVLHAQATVIGALGELGVARADRWPSVAIGGSLVRSINEAQRKATNTGAIGSIGPLIDIPLFDWGLRRAKQHAKDAALQAAVFGYRRSVLVAVGEVENALATLEAQRVRAQQQADAAQALDDAARATRTRHALGLASGMDVADSEAERVQAALELDDARASHALAYIALCKALGGDPRDGAPPASAPGAGEGGR